MFEQSIAKLSNPNYLGKYEVVDGLVRDFVGAVMNADTEADIISASHQFAKIFAGHDPEYTQVEGWCDRFHLGRDLVKYMDVDDEQNFFDIVRTAFIEFARQLMTMVIKMDSEEQGRKALDELIGQFSSILLGAGAMVVGDDLIKSHVAGYTRKSGVHVHPYDRAGGAHPQPVNHPRLSENSKKVLIANPHRPSKPSTWHSPQSIATFVPNGDAPATLNGVPFTTWRDHPKTKDGWSFCDGINWDLEEPDMPEVEGKHASAGVVIQEPDGRVWVAHPTNAFGGYQATWPKGTIDPGENTQGAACRETWEETGLKVRIVGLLGDFEKTTSVSRMYLAVREGGTPIQMGWETQAMSLVPMKDLRRVLNMPNDQAIVDALESAAKSPQNAKVSDK